jgi:hypothetical protein
MVVPNNSRTDKRCQCNQQRGLGSLALSLPPCDAIASPCAGVYATGGPIGPRPDLSVCERGVTDVGFGD